MTDSSAPEAWVEINIPAKASPDIDLLRNVVDPLVHRELADDIATWHFFWEPELRLRLRWSDPSRQAEIESRLAEILNSWRDKGLLDSWSTGNHGEVGERHRGEAEEYGPESWDLIQKEWENGSALALRLLLLNETGGLTGRTTPTIEDHWARHVHLYTNRIYGFPPDSPWAAEIVRCLSQARGYLRRAIQVLADHSGYEGLIERYAEMEQHTNNALSAWNDGRSSEPQTRD